MNHSTNQDNSQLPPVSDYLDIALTQVNHVQGVSDSVQAKEIQEVGIVGGGTMGCGIAMALVDAGLPVVLVEVDDETLDISLERIHSAYESSFRKGRLSENTVYERLKAIRGSTSYTDLKDVDLVIEAVNENLGLKKQVFCELDAVCKKEAILATNTSVLDLDNIARSTSRPELVVGLHFSAPANVMPLLEIIRGQHTKKEVIATSLKLAGTLGKTGVVVGVCFGFVSNRMFLPYIREAQHMLLEGITPQRIDEVMSNWGMAMGPNAVSDLSGIDVAYSLLHAWEQRPKNLEFCRLLFVLYEMGRFGRKTGLGIYSYSGGKAQIDPEFMEIAREQARLLGVPQREIEDEEIIERLIFPMINEGALILEEGVARRPGDIDQIIISAYGFPRSRGGPMYYADTMGLKLVLERIKEYGRRYGEQYWKPAPLLWQLVKEGKTFFEWNAARSV